MYPFIRFGTTIVKALNARCKGETISITEMSKIEIMSNPTDMDNFFEMNNGRIFTLFDLGRNDFAIRSGIGGLLIKNRWGLVVAGSSIQYRKRVYAFSKVTIKTRLVGIDDKWIYLQQSMWVKGQPTSTALLRTGITDIRTGKAISPQHILKAMGQPNFEYPLEDWVQAWAEADRDRPWPPKS